MTTIRDYHPADGQAFQGDVAIVPVPKGIAISPVDEIAPTCGKLILQEGEVTGHHHGIDILERSVKHPAAETAFDAALSASRAAEALGASKATVDQLIADVQARRIPVPTARMFRDAAAADAMVRAGILTRPDLVVGFLVIEHGPMVVSHPEHDGIRLPVGTYYVGRQVESAGAEERVVRD